MVIVVQFVIKHLSVKHEVTH